MGRKATYKAGDVVTWRTRGYPGYGTVVATRSLSQRVAYTIIVTDPFGAWEGSNKVVHKWAHQLQPVVNLNGKPRRSPRTVRLWKEGSIG